MGSFTIFIAVLHVNNSPSGRVWLFLLGLATHYQEVVYSHYQPSLVVRLQPLICMLLLLLKYGKLLTSHISPALAPTYYSEVFFTLQGLHNDITTHSFLYNEFYCYS